MTFRSRRVLRTLTTQMIAVVVATSIAPMAAAADWPSTTVRFVAPVAAGGGGDAVARTLADALQKRWRQPVVIDNRPGSHAAVAIRAFLEARDGHTLLFSQVSPVTTNPVWFQKLSYDPLRDLVPVTTVMEDFLVIAATPTIGVDSLPQLLSLARQKRGEWNYTTAGSSPDLTFLTIQRRAGTDLLYVPYRSLTSSIPDLTQGRIQVAIMPLGSLLGQARAGKVKLLAVMNDKRCPAAPDVPTLAEAGYPDLTHNGLNGLFARKEMPQELRDRIAADVRAVLKDPAVSQRLNTLGYIARPSSPDEFASILQAMLAKWTALARTLELKPAK